MKLDLESKINKTKETISMLLEKMDLEGQILTAVGSLGTSDHILSRVYDIKRNLTLLRQNLHESENDLTDLIEFDNKLKSYEVLENSMETHMYLLDKLYLHQLDAEEFVKVTKIVIDSDNREGDPLSDDCKAYIEKLHKVMVKVANDDYSLNIW